MKATKPIPATELISKPKSLATGDITQVNTAGVRVLGQSIWIKLLGIASDLVILSDGIVTTKIPIFRDEIFEAFFVSTAPIVVTNTDNTLYYYCVTDCTEQTSDVAVGIWDTYQARINADPRIGKGVCPILKKM